MRLTVHVKWRTEGDWNSEEQDDFTSESKSSSIFTDFVPVNNLILQVLTFMK